MINLLIALEVPKEIKESITNLRRYIIDKDKTNNYGNHEAHITLFVNTFRNFSEVEKEVKKIAKATKPFSAITKGAYAFPYDPLNSKGRTIVYRIEDNKELRKLQKNIYDETNHLRTHHQVEWINKVNPNLSKEQKNNVKKYGFPFAPEDYIHHASIGTVTEKNYNKIWKHIEQNNIKKRWKVNHLTIYISLGDDGFKVYKRYKFGK